MVTLKEIAKRTGVAESTISRILNRDPTLSISDEKRRRVVETAEALQYVMRRSRSSRKEDASIALRRPGDLRSVMIVHFLSSASELSQPFYVGLRQGIEARAEAYGMATTRLFAGEFDPAMLTRGRNVGIISVGDLPDGHLEAIRALGVATVLAHPQERPVDVDVAYVDLWSASTRLCEWLLTRGVRQPALVGVQGPQSRRLAAFRSVMSEAGLFDPDYVTYARDSSDDGQDQIRTLFSRLADTGKPLPDAVVIYADRTAVEVYRGLEKAKLSIPRDVQVVAFNDSSIAHMLAPELSTLRLEAGVIGETAVDLLMERHGGRKAAKHVQILPTIIERGSTRKP
ncbi:LacI family DNA-binding transcriptional regulator [Martelella sp. AD-3]|uniref:LacI family DNA-binding transcriptional regulator n=1 Tax=Martelella sp. AD-3 TaxID=686597 RepID=UPI000466547B|nr:LacI family DNA-binding transcriptional regulator [Martelella sp. AD-3]AMM87234.1 hypothetical protein AZF01_22215 [Martelella sp. AD-3]